MLQQIATTTKRPAAELDGGGWTPPGPRRSAPSTGPAWVKKCVRAFVHDKGRVRCLPDGKDYLLSDPNMPFDVARTAKILRDIT